MTPSRGPRWAMGRRVLCGLCVLLLGAAGGCQMHVQPAPALQWVLVGVQPSNISLRDQRLRLRLHVRNGTDVPARLAALRLHLDVAGEALAAAQLGGFIDIAPGTTRELDVVTPIAFAALGKLLAARRAGGDYRLSGHVVHAHAPGTWPLQVSGRLSDVQMRPLPEAEAGL